MRIRTRFVAAAGVTLVSVAMGSLLLRLAWRWTHTIELVDDVVVLLILTLGVGVLAWYALTGVVTCTVLAIGSAGRGCWAGEIWLRDRGAPALRRLAAVGAVTSAGLGAGVGLAAGSWAHPAPSDALVSSGIVTEQDDEGVASLDDGLPFELGWTVTTQAGHGSEPKEPQGVKEPESTLGTVETPDRPEPPGEQRLTPAAPLQQARPVLATPSSAQPVPEPSPAADGNVPTRHLVAPGESLWAITAAHLASGDPVGGVPPGRVAAEWLALYEANAEAIGPDPDLILPGQVLSLPSSWFEEER